VSAGSRSYATILRTNVFSFYNSILFVIGIALLALGRKLDRLQLLDRTPVQVLRDGREVERAPDAVVRGDVLVLRPGGQPRPR
jgi:cation-transporting ATPase E